MSTSSEERRLPARGPDYGPLGLVANPFPMTGISSHQTPYPLIEEHIDTEVRLFIQESLLPRRFGGLAVLGEYGAGKTYALRYVQNILERVGRPPHGNGPEAVVPQQVLTVYTESPSTTLLGLVADVCNRIGRTRIRNALLEMVLADLASVLAPDAGDEHGRAARVKADYVESTRGRLLRGEDVFARLTSPDAAPNPSAALHALRSGGENPAFLRGFATTTLGLVLGDDSELADDVASHLADFALAENEDGSRLWATLFQGKLTSRGKQLGSISARAIWSSMMRVLSHAGYYMVYWLIDEFEEMGLQQRRALASMRQFLAEYRDLIDANLEGFAVAVACHPHSWAVYRDLCPQFCSRFSRVALLGPNSPDDLRRMIERQLALVRTGSLPEDPLAPFSDSAITAISRLSAGNTRVGLEACFILLWHVATTGEDRITSNMVSGLGQIRRTFLFARQGG